MPEHDVPSCWPDGVPSLLVGYYGTLLNSSQDSFDGRIEMNLPVDEPYFVINMICETERGMVCLPYEINKENGTVSWRLSKNLESGKHMPFMLEYYSSPFAEGPRKELLVIPVFPNAMTDITVDIVEPSRTSGFSVTPSPEQTYRRDDNFVTHRIDVKSLSAGEPLPIEISYVKPNNKPSIFGDTGTPPSNDLPPLLPPAQKSENLTGYIFIAGAMAFFGLMVFLGLQSNRNRRKPKTSRARATPKARNSRGRTQEQEKRKARKLLLAGKISENTYKQLLKDI
jgi:hypothetical protein